MRLSDGFCCGRCGRCVACVACLLACCLACCLVWRMDLAGDLRLISSSSSLPDSP